MELQVGEYYLSTDKSIVTIISTIHLLESNVSLYLGSNGIYYLMDGTPTTPDSKDETLITEVKIMELQVGDSNDKQGNEIVSIASELLDKWSNKVNKDDKDDKELTYQAVEKAHDKQIGGKHYKDTPLQPWDIIDKLKLSFYEGNALKYLLRYKDKNGVEDLEKAKHYIDKIIEDMEK